MTLQTKRTIIAVLAFIFLLSLLLVQRLEVARRYQEAGLAKHPVAVPAAAASSAAPAAAAAVGVAAPVAGEPVRGDRPGRRPGAAHDRGQGPRRRGHLS